MSGDPAVAAPADPVDRVGKEVPVDLAAQAAQGKDLEVQEDPVDQGVCQDHLQA